MFPQESFGVLVGIDNSPPPGENREHRAKDRVRATEPRERTQNMIALTTAEEIKRIRESNRRHEEKQRKLRWDRTTTHPLFAWAKDTILNFLSPPPPLKTRETGVIQFRDFARNLIDCQGEGLAQAALLSLREEGRVILNREDPLIPIKEYQDPNYWLILRTNGGNVKTTNAYNVITVISGAQDLPPTTPQVGENATETLDG